ncbi:hypothetical protein MLD38_016503 [Melastoma candidum]|uniref:Uncharacterized protein n=1 Tax=Melastoma candidum TaxID=119954 RepID=A0ACB9QN70_9MYRT|nr:hypothetical protein MLD38_016503 [Melastoma candidum]
MRPTGSAAEGSSVLMDIDKGQGIPGDQRPKWRKVAYGGMQPGYGDNYTDDSFLEDLVMNANVVKRDMVKVMLDSVAISQYLSIVSLVGVVWTYSLQSRLDQKAVLVIDAGLLMSGFLILLLTEKMISCTVRAPGTWRKPTLTSCISLNASIVASVFVAARLPSWGDVFAMMMFSLLVFLFAPLVTFCIKKAVRINGFHYGGLSLLVDKDAGVQVRD